MDSEKVKFSTKIRALLSAMMFNLCIGSYYLYGNINTVVSEYLKNNGNPDITDKTTVII